jgi:CRISPR-associated protein Cmr2
LSYDLYATIRCQSQNDVDGLVNGRVDQQEISNIYARIELLAPALLREERWNGIKGKDYAHEKYRNLVFRLPDHTNTKYATEVIAVEKQRLEQLGLWKPNPPDFAALPAHSAFLQFQFTLASPYISRDDEIFHINDNPVRKDKVFKAPMVAGSAWKGNLRWTAIHLLTLRWHETQDAGQLAAGRFRLTLLFGDEVGEGENRGLAPYLDKLSGEAADLYRQQIRAHFPPPDSPSVPNHAGRVRFYPTFFDRISLEVINPHDRATRAGKQPIYFESVPVGAGGVFSLLYVPFETVTEADAREDLALVAEAIREMMLTYGFSAKKSSGFGEAADEIEGQMVTTNGSQPVSKLSTLANAVASTPLSQ